MAPHSSTLAWKIPWMEEPGGLQSMGSLRVRHDWATSLSLFTFHFHALEKEMATHSSVLAWGIPGAGEPGGLMSMGVTQSQTWLKWFSSSSICIHDMHIYVCGLKLLNQNNFKSIIMLTTITYLNLNSQKIPSNGYFLLLVLMNQALHPFHILTHSFLIRILSPMN